MSFGVFPQSGHSPPSGEVEIGPFEGVPKFRAEAAACLSQDLCERIEHSGNLMTAASDFEEELEIFRTEADAAAQYLYAYLSIHETAGHRRSVHALLNTAPLFWNTTLSALTSKCIHRSRSNF